MHRLLAASAGLTLVLSLSACGGEDTEASEAISKSVTKSGANGLGLDQKQGDCVGDGWVDEIGVDKLKEYGVVTEEAGSEGRIDEVKMSKEDADSAASVLGECTDLTDLLLAQAGDQVEPAAADCISKAVDEDDVEDLYATVFTGEEPAQDSKVGTAVTECITAG